MRSGFVAVVGRPNVGKSTLVNAMVGTKVTITSPRPNTTRHRIRGVLHLAGAQAVFVDTPGLHRPRTALGQRLNETAAASLEEIDQVVVVVDATAPIGPGDRMVLSRAHAAARRAARESPDGLPVALMVVVNKADRAGPAQVLEHLAQVSAAVAQLDAAAHPTGDAPSTLPPTDRPADRPTDPPAAEPEVPVEYFPVSARTGKGVDALVAAIVAALPEGPPYFPAEVVSDTPEALFVAELVREQLLLRTRDELPHSIACRVTEWEWPRIRCEILVERDSQKGIVIGHKGEVLKAVGTAARAALDPEVFLELVVRVEKHWQQRDDALDRLGY